MLVRAGKGSLREGEDTPAWILTYGTVITLLLVFFVGIYSLSAVDAQKLRDLLSQRQGVQENGSLSNPAGIDHQIQPPQGMITLEQKMRQIYLETRNFLNENDLDQQVEVRYGDQGVFLEIKEKTLFNPGRADLKPEARKILGALARLLSRLPYQVWVEGHTDNRIINSAEYPTNWELSAARASGVVRYFTEFHGLDPAKFAAVGYGEFRPVKPNSTAANQEMNRRMQLAIYALDVYEKEVAQFERTGTD
ncbi:MAG: OmpA family protein [Bacillota bacterium]